MASIEDFDINAQLHYYKEELRRLWTSHFSFEQIKGSSLSILEAKNKAWNIAATQAPILIRGESGTGKRLFAHAIHLDSPHREGPLLFINCQTEASSIREQLFGDTRGNSGLFSRTNIPGFFSRGTVVLLHVEHLSEETQNLIAAQLNDIESYNKEISSYPRFIAIISQQPAQGSSSLGPHNHLAELLAPSEIYLPPLRTRLEDIPAICHRFITELNQTTGTTVQGMSEDATDLMMQYAWPENVAELKAIVDRAGVDAQTGIIGPEHLYLLRERMADIQYLPTLKQATMRAEKDAILKALIQSNGNKKLASERLGITRTSFYNKLRELDIQV